MLLSVPTHLDSSPTLEFIEFTAEQAKILYEARRRKQIDLSMSIPLLDWAIDHLSYACFGVEDDSEDWTRIMTEAGIKPQIRHALMKTEHTNIRLTQGLMVWLEEIVGTYFLALLDLNKKIRDGLNDNIPSLQRGGDEGYTVPQTPGDHLALFKSVEYRRCADCFAEDGSVFLGRLESTGPTDFARRGGLYFNHQLWVAKHYAALIKDTCPVADRRTVAMHVPLHHFRTVKTLELNMENDLYKELLYYSRREEKYPKHIAKLRAEYGIIRGPIGHVHNKAFRKMKSWRDITSKHQLIEESEEYGHGEESTQGQQTGNDDTGPERKAKGTRQKIGR